MIAATWVKKAVTQNACIMNPGSIGGMAPMSYKVVESMSDQVGSEWI